MEETPVIDIEIVQGEDFELRFRMLDSNRDPVSFAGQTFAMMIRAEIDEPVVANLTSENGKISWDEDSGVFTVQMSGSETGKLKLEDTGVYDLFAYGAKSDKLIRGAVSFERSVTR